MSYPLIILGAGASYDYSKFAPVRPPITKELVAGSYLNGDLLKKYALASVLLSEIESAVNTHGQSFEQALYSIKERSGHIPEVQSQFISLEFYLQELFQQVSAGFQKINNYKILQQHINTYFGGRACVVSFNYDSLFEDSIIGDSWNKMNDYISSNLKVIKLHGSHNWLYITQKGTVDFSDDYNDGYDFLIKNPHFLVSLRAKGGIAPYHKEELKRDTYFKFPALAVPLPAKQDPIICPKSHIDILQKELSDIGRILIIGWRAADDYLLNLMKENVKRHVKFLVVSKEEESASEIVKRVSDKTGLSGEGIFGGFNNFVGSKKYHDFFV